MQMLQQLDLYEALCYEGSKGIYKGSNGRGAIFYGRIGEPMTGLPNMLLRGLTAIQQDQLIAETKAFKMDIYAVQTIPSDRKSVFRAEGRILLICPKEQEPNSCVAYACKLFYNTLSTLMSDEANLVVGCYYSAPQNNIYIPMPAIPVSVEDIAITKYRDAFIKELIEPATMINPYIRVQGDKTRKLGNECALLLGLNNETPVFYTKVNGYLSLQPNFKSIYANYVYKDIYETKDNWRVAPNLDKALGYTIVSENKSCLAVRKPSAIIDKIQESIVYAGQMMQMGIEKFFSDPHEEITAQLDSYCERLKQYLSLHWDHTNNGQIGSRRTGMLVTTLLRFCLGISKSDADELRTSLISEMQKSEILYTLFQDKPWRKEDNLNKLEKRLAYGNLECAGKYITLIAFIWATLGLKADFKSIILNTAGIKSVLYAILNKPYSFALIYTDFTVAELDLLACFVGKANNEGIIPMRSVAYMHTIMGQSKSVIVPVQQLKYRVDIQLTRFTEAYILKAHTFLSPEQINLSYELFGALDNRFYRADTYVANKDMWFKYAPMLTRKDLVFWYKNSGLGIKIEINGIEYLMDIANASVFVAVNRRLYDSALIENNVVEQNIYDNWRSVYEQENNIRLEEEQANIVSLLKYRVACMIGSAGTGKTTALKYLLYILQNVYGYKTSEILLVAPTARAARRMTECTGFVASTLHSAFKIATDNLVWKTAEDLSQEVLKDYKFIIFDETSMVSLVLLHKCLARIAPETQMLFVGDIAQLPPISIGKPFIDMLKYLPYIKLTVPKRVESGSVIYKNCNALIDNSGDTIVEGKDFKLISAKAIEIADIISDLCQMHLGLIIKETNYPVIEDETTQEPKIYAAEDIQVITPVNSTNYNFSTYSLNNSLRKVFNPSCEDNIGIVFQCNDLDYSMGIGDKVVNSVNSYEAKRYILDTSAKDNKLTFISGGTIGKGIVNGDIGYIRYIDFSDNMVFKEYTEKGLVIDIQQMKLAKGANKGDKVYVMVEFIGTDGNKFYIKYQCTTKKSLSSYTQVVPTYELKCLRLAYALSIHKMQGSQAKMIISVLWPVADNFSSRNMLYTAWSRASENIYVVGDIKYSTIDKMRQIVATAERVTPFDIVII